MATIVREEKYIKSDTVNNNNKFWYIEVYDDGEVITRYGRVGDAGQSRVKQLGDLAAANKFADKKVKEKLRDGRNKEIAYRPLNVVSNSTPTVTSVRATSKARIAQIAKQQIDTNNPTATKLIDYFTKVNAHDIAAVTGGQITFDFASGSFQTPLGLVSQENINDANAILVEIGDLVAENKYAKTLSNLTNDYLMLVPQDIGRRRLEIRSFWHDLAAVQKQKGIVDALEASLASATKSTDDDKGKTKKKEDPEIFSVKLHLAEDPKVINRIKRFYKKGKRGHHACAHLDVKRVYTVSISTVDTAYSNAGATMDNQWQLWHGTRASNCLSILKGGLVIPPSSSAHCTGRMFGNGVYASDTSTKALNYAYGYWDRKSVDNNCFMFLLQMAMGKYYSPNGYNYGWNSGAKRGYDSTFAEAGRGGVQQNEMIAYRTSQVKLTHLVEFSPHGK